MMHSAIQSVDITQEIPDETSDKTSEKKEISIEEAPSIDLSDINIAPPSIRDESRNIASDKSDSGKKTSGRRKLV